jgi:hypothetical protein
LPRLSAEAAPVECSDIRPAVRELAGDLLPDTRRLAREMSEHLFATMQELRERDDGELPEETRTSCEVNIAQVLRLLSSGAGPDALVLPPEAAEWARSLVRRGITLVALLRAYRLGHAWLWDRWSQALHDRIPHPEELVAAQERSSAFMFDYIDLISSVLVAEYGTERERMMRSAEQLRAETVRTILAGGPVDEEVATRRLGYELRRHHLALRVSGRGRELRGGPGGRRCARRRRAARGGLGRRQRRCLVGGIRAARGGGSRRLCAARGDPGRRRATRPRPRRLPALARRGAGGRARGGAGGRRRGSRHALRTRRAPVAAGERLPARTGIRSRAPRPAGRRERAGRAAARDRARLPRRERQRHAGGQGALRPPQHGCLPREAGRGCSATA